MSLVFYLIHNRTPSMPGGQVDVGNAAVRLDGVELVQAAAVGEAASSTIELEDPNATLTPTGLWFFRVDDNSLASNTGLYWGVVGDRTARRDADRALITGASRLWVLELADLNAHLGFRMLTADDADRPAETADARLRWLLANSYAPFHDHGNVVYPTNAMDAANYHGRYFRDVLADISLVSGYNFWTDVRQSDGQVSLFFFDTNTSTAYGTPLRISNVMSDVTADTSGWTYYPSTDGELHRSASRVASGIQLPYTGGDVFVRSEAIASNFGYRDLSAPMATVSTEAKALVLAARFSGESGTEDDTVTVTVQVPTAAVPMVKHGHRTWARFQHLDGWESGRHARIKRLALIQDKGTIETMRLRLELTPTEEAAEDYTGAAFGSLVDSESFAAVSPINYRFTGDAPDAGWYVTPTVSTYLTPNATTNTITVSRTMVVRIHAKQTFSTVATVASATISVLSDVRGVIATATVSVNQGLASWTGAVEIDSHNVTVNAGEVLSVTGAQVGFLTGGWAGGIPETFFRVGRGSFSWSTGTISWEGP